MNKKQILIKANQLLAKEKDWVKGEWYNRDRTVFSLHGAIACASGLVDVLEQTHTILVKDLPTGFVAPPQFIVEGQTGRSTRIRKKLDPTTVIMDFNDDRGTTFADIKALLKRAIDDA